MYRTNVRFAVGREGSNLRGGMEGGRVKMTDKVHSMGLSHEEHRRSRLHDTSIPGGYM